MVALRPAHRMLQRSAMALALLVAPLAAWATPAPTQAAVGDLYINEILFDPPGADDQREYIELRGIPNLNIADNTYLLVVEANATGGGNNPGDVRNIFTLGDKVTGSNGFLVLLQNNTLYTNTVNAAASVYTNTAGIGFGTAMTGTIGHRADAATTTVSNTIANTSNAFFLIEASTPPQLNNDYDTNNDGQLDLPVGVTVLDSVGITDGEAQDFGYGNIVFRRNPTSVVDATTKTIVEATTVSGPFTADYVGRVGDSAGWNANEWVASESIDGTAPNYTLDPKLTLPDSLISSPLNHIGTTNPVGSNRGPLTNCVPSITTGFGTAASGALSAVDSSSRVVSATLTRATGSPLAPTGAITFTNQVVPSAPGGTFAVSLTVAADTPINTYTYTVRFFNDEDPQVSTPCNVVIKVEATEPVIPACPSPVAAVRGTPTAATLTATDADSTVTSAVLTSVTPANPGITLGSVTAATGDGGTLSTSLNISSSITGTFTATVSFSNDEATPQTATCEVVINVAGPAEAPFGVTLTGGPATGSAPLGVPLTLTAASTDTTVVSFTFRLTSNLTTTVLTTTVNNNPATASFTPTIEGVFTVTATANTGALATRTFTFTNGAPTASAIARVAGISPTTGTLTVPPTTTVTLDGSGSSDAAADLGLHLPLTYTWTQVAQTGVPTVTLNTTSDPALRTFNAPNVTTPTTFTFQLVVADRFGKPSAPTLVRVVVDPNAKLQRFVRLSIILNNPAAARR